jgi:pyroglutamyl-peptidase
MTRPTILLTGFGPFGDETRNPSGELALDIAESHGLPADVRAAVLPVVFRETEARIRDLLLEAPPDCVLSLGLAAGSPTLRLERVGVNFRRGADAAGNATDGEPIVPDAPAAYFASLPVPELIAALHRCGIPAQDSFSAGTYCCNEALFAALHLCATQRLRTRAGFVHLPCFPEQVRGRNIPSMARDVQREGLVVILRTLLDAFEARAARRTPSDEGAGVPKPELATA